MLQTFFLGGFECSTHRRRDGKRLDLIAASHHDRFAARDYRALKELGIRAARDGLRWAEIEQAPGRYDWSSFLPMLRAADDAGVQVFWDLCHYGWPDDIDIWSADFVARFTGFAAAAARLIVEETGKPPLVCPVNEISFWAWAGGEVAFMNPGARGRGAELKQQLARAAIGAVDAVRREHPGARFLFAEPTIHIDGGADPVRQQGAKVHRLAQFEALDMISGLRWPELGGSPDRLDLVGVNYYPENQWYYEGSTIPLGHHAYVPFSELLRETHARYGRPLLIAETGAEGSARAAWLHYIMGEVRIAMDAGVPIEGVCLYPVLDCPGWDNDRLRPVGLFSAPDREGRRTVHQPLARELAIHQARLDRPPRREGRAA
jgi:hypothetical protein